MAVLQASWVRLSQLPICFELERAGSDGLWMLHGG